MGILVTEKKIIKINNECHAHPVYLEWHNKLGGTDNWLFDRDNETTSRTSIVSAYQSVVSDLETAIGQNDIIGKSISPTISIGARIAAEDMDGIRSLYESPKVLMLMNRETWAADGPIWQRVIVAPGSLLVLKTNSSFIDVKLTLNIPIVNSQQE